MVPRQKDVILRGVVMVPRGQGVIPRRPRGGASCKSIIPRRPRGDASFLEHNSTATWWCLIMSIRIVKSWGILDGFDNLCVNVGYSCLTLRLYVDSHDIGFLCTNLPCLLVWLSCMWLIS